MPFNLSTIVRQAILAEGADGAEDYQGIQLAQLLSKPRALERISYDKEDQAILLAAAIGISGNESLFNKSVTYLTGKGRSVLKSRDVQAFMSSVIPSKFEGGDADPSIGPTQIKYGNVSPSARAAIGIESPQDLIDVYKAILATAIHLSDLYDKAKDLGYSIILPGQNPRSIREDEAFVSTGNAALDLAIAAYNGRPEKVLNRFCFDKRLPPNTPEHEKIMSVRVICGTQRDIPGKEEVDTNYIPSYTSGQPVVGTDAQVTKNTVAYVSKIAKIYPTILTNVRKAMKLPDIPVLPPLVDMTPPSERK